MIDIRGITKTYQIKKSNSRLALKERYVNVLDDIHLNIKKGELFVLLGENGAGKTTLIKIICGLIQPTKGSVFIDNRPPQEAEIRIGLMLGYTMIYYRMTGYDNLEYFAKLYKVENYKERIKELCDFLGLGDWIFEYVEHYSTGMKAKLSLARALIHNPDILLLDEPTSGLDPHIAIEVRNKIKGMGKTIILTTHYINEAECLSDRIGFLKKGKLVGADTSQNLKQITGKGEAISLEEVFNILMQEC
jgi:ABC-2 type transport system ATP-binding protein